MLDQKQSITLRKDLIDLISRTIWNEIVSKHSLSVHEMIFILGKLMYSLGASLAGYTGKGPNIEELKKLYYSKPDLNIALMLNGLTVQTWTQDIKEEKGK